MTIFFVFEWTKGNVVNKIIRHCLENDIDFRYDRFNNLEVNVNGKWAKTDYECNDNIVTVTLNYFK